MENEDWRWISSRLPRVDQLALGLWDASTIVKAEHTSPEDNGSIRSERWPVEEGR